MCLIKLAASPVSFPVQIIYHIISVIKNFWTPFVICMTYFWLEEYFPLLWRNAEPRYFWIILLHETLLKSDKISCCTERIFLLAVSETGNWTTQLTWLRTVYSGDWCLRSALCTLSGACQKWWWWWCQTTDVLNVSCSCMYAIICVLCWNWCRFLGRFSQFWSLVTLTKWLTWLMTRSMDWRLVSLPRTSTQPSGLPTALRPALSGKLSTSSVIFIWPLVCLSIHFCVRLFCVDLINSKTKRHRKTKVVGNVSQGRSSFYTISQLKGSRVDISERQRLSENGAVFVLHFLLTPGDRLLAHWGTCYYCLKCA